MCVELLGFVGRFFFLNQIWRKTVLLSLQILFLAQFISSSSRSPIHPMICFQHLFLYLLYFVCFLLSFIQFIDFCSILANLLSIHLKMDIVYFSYISICFLFIDSVFLPLFPICSFIVFSLKFQAYCNCPKVFAYWCQHMSYPWASFYFCDLSFGFGHIFLFLVMSSNFSLYTGHCVCEDIENLDLTSSKRMLSLILADRQFFSKISLI